MPDYGLGCVDILGYQVSAGGLDSDVQACMQMLECSEHLHHVACANPHSLVIADDDVDFSASLSNAELLLPDGVGIVLAARIMGLQINGRVAGNEFFLSLSDRLNTIGGFKYFFLGSTENTLKQLVRRMSSQYPGIEVCGTYSPPFKEDFSEDDDKRMLNAVNEARPDVLWVGMTAPKQEKWVERNRERLEVPVVASIGAVFDFFSGTKKRAPDWVCNMGLEWLPRLMREPRRLFKRNFISSPLFLSRVLKQRIRQAVQ